ncbi:MAG: sigma-70 family RNA polymerase sigma factor [Candidatus Izemoplasmatales bacterium]|nr:sigma-70 family RNA polymerase sigma factor [Candidatus Izemoplasmatales bacterium]
MDFRIYNDFEIIAMVQEGCEEALNLMASKYKLFIAKKIGKFNLGYEYDDAFQEGLIVLYKSIKKFKPEFNKTFTRYFELNLENRYITIIRSKSRYYKFLNEKLPLLFDYEIRESPHAYFTKDDFNDFVNQLSSFEKDVFQMKFFHENTHQEIATNLNCDTKKVYNAIDRIRTKLKLHLE